MFLLSHNEYCRYIIFSVKKCASLIERKLAKKFYRCDACSGQSIGGDNIVGFYTPGGATTEDQILRGEPQCGIDLEFEVFGEFQFFFKMNLAYQSGGWGTF
jgi:hypothetical protein